MADLNPLFDPSTDNIALKSGAQQMINTPLAGGTLNEAELAFVQKIKSLIANGTINLYTPSSLINQDAYMQLTEQMRGMADQSAINFLAKIREIIDLELNPADTLYQEKNLIQSTFFTKSRLSVEIQKIFLI